MTFLILNKFNFELLYFLSFISILSFQKKGGRKRLRRSDLPSPNRGWVNAMTNSIYNLYNFHKKIFKRYQN